MIADSSGGDAKKRKAIIKQETSDSAAVVHVPDVHSILTTSSNFLFGYDSSIEFGVPAIALPSFPVPDVDPNNYTDPLYNLGEEEIVEVFGQDPSGSASINPGLLLPHQRDQHPSEQYPSQPAPTFEPQQQQIINLPQAFQSLHELYVTMMNCMTELRQVLQVTPIPMGPETVQAVSAAQHRIRKFIEEGTLEARKILQTDLLAPQDEGKLSQFITDLYVQLKQLQIYEHEAALAERGQEGIVASMVIIKQPFPQTIMKQRHIPDPVAVRLLTGLRVPIRPNSKVKASVLLEDSIIAGAVAGAKVPPKVQVGVENDVQDMTADGLAVFNTIRFSEGSEQRRMRLQFEVQVESQQGSAAVRSDLSEPLMILTHQTQWEAAEGALFKVDTFRGLDGVTPQQEVSWARFANALQRHFLRVTQGARPLSRGDLQYLHSRFEFAPKISASECDTFWKWFGKVLYKIRHHKYLQFWVKGIIYGFINKQDSNSLLQNQMSGTFVIRFSEGNAGQFAIAYRKDNQIHHYLMSDEDQKKSMSDFLSERSSFEVLLRVTTDMATGTSTLQHCPKSAIIEEFQPARKKDPVKSTAGYEQFVK